MMNIAVCDDDSDTLSKLRTILCSLAEEPQARFRFFAGADALAQHIRQWGGFDLYLLDVIMPGIDGIALAKEIRSRGERCEIVFLTSSREFAVEAFGVEACGYLVKPITEEKLREAVEKAAARLRGERQCRLVVKTGGGIRRIDAVQIVYVENVKHYQHIHLRSGEELAVYGKISELFEALTPAGRFLMPRHSYIVNMNDIVTITPMAIEMAGGAKIPLIRNSYGKVCRQYMDHMFRDGSGESGN